MSGDEIEKKRLQQEAEDIKFIMDSESGRRFVWRMMEYCGIYRDIEGGGQESDRQIGKRRVGLYLLGIIGESEELALFKMMQEARNRKMDEQFKIDSRVEAGNDNLSPVDYNSDLLNDIL